MWNFQGLLVLLLVLVMLAACSTPLDSDDAGQVEEAATASPTIDMPVLKIVTPTPVDPSQIPPDATATPEFLEVPDTYVVQEGDSIYTIAARYRLEIAAIVELNQLSDPNDIQVGQELQLPDPVPAQ